MRTASWTRSVSVLDRLSAVLDAFHEDGEGLSVTELARRAHLPKSTVSRIAAELVDEGYLDRDGATLYLGVRLFELGQSVTRPQRLRGVSRPLLTDLRNATGHEAWLAVPDGEYAVIVAQASGRDPRSTSPAVGRRLSSGGTALDAVFDALTLDDRRSPGPDVPAVCMRRDEDGLCLAAPVMHHRQVVAAVSVRGEVGAVDPGIVTPLLRSTSVGLTRRLDVL